MRGFIVMGLMKNLAIGGARSARSTRSTGTSSTGGSGYVEVIGFNETDKMLGELMTTDPYMARKVKTFIRKALKQARKELSDDAKKYLKSDPRRAARAVKFSVYKAMFGGNLSILQKGRGTAGARYKLIRKKKLQPGQRGGNRITRVDDSRNRLETYFGSDRGFILRFIASGTEQRRSRYGNRGSIRQTDWFGHTAPWHLQDAAAAIATEISNYIKTHK
jgi:hypothetical protein